MGAKTVEGDVPYFAKTVSVESLGSSSRVVIVSHHALPHVGGVEVLVDKEMRALISEGCAVTHITSDLMGSADRPVYPGEATVVRVPAWHFLERKARLAYPIFSPSIFFTMWRAIGKADVVHVHGFIFMSSVVATLVAALRRKPVVLTDHGGIMPLASKRLDLLMKAASFTLGRITTRIAKKLIANNMRVLRDLERLSGRVDKSLFLPYPVDTEMFSPPSPEERAAARREFGWSDERPKVLFAGRITEDKGCLLLLAAKSERFDLVFVGPGNPDILNLPREGVTYLPPRPQRDLVKLYHASDLFALPSRPRREGFPIATREALACGLKAVMSYEEGYAPYRRIPNLWFCEDLSPANLREMIEKTLRAPMQRAVDDPDFGITPAKWVGRIYAGMLI
jgi:glycosyltransferase involved in cell wall biosynthesis